MDYPTGSMFMFQHQDPSFFAENHFDTSNPDGIGTSSDPFNWNMDICNDDILLGQGYDFINFDDTVFEDANSNPTLPFAIQKPHHDCSFCQILREITHTNGSIVKCLQIHGMFGVITHATVKILGFGPSTSSQAENIQMIDFGDENTKAVKKFMLRYFDTCNQEGYSLIQDPLSVFYEALCVGLYEIEDPEESLQLSPENTGKRPKQSEGGSKKIPLAEQRERTKNLKLKDIVGYSDLRIEEAALRMKVCATVMKKLCRKNGVKRWPHRKIKSLRKMISKKSKILDTGDEQARAKAQVEIHKLQQELDRIYEVFNK